MAQESGGGKRGVGPGADGQVVDKRANDDGGTGEIGGAAGEGRAINDVRMTGGVGEEGRPRGLSGDARGDAEGAGGGS